MKNQSPLLLAFTSIILLTISCTRQEPQSFTVAFYNVENLFDTIDDPNSSDERYVPDSDLKWGKVRYQHKLDNLAKVMSSIDSNSYPALFGLCEVENDVVVKDLINHELLTGANYQIIHKNSPDERGIDVALLYQADTYQPIANRFLKIPFPDSIETLTRDILYSKGVIGQKDSIHIFVNHWVSRWGGQEQTEPLRIFTAQYIKGLTDSIFQKQANANIIITGDLNDNPTDKSIWDHLEAREAIDAYQENELYNLGYTKFKEGEGSLYYKSWDMFDQVIVSSALLTGSNGLITGNGQSIFKEDWMLYKPKEGEARPSRTASRNYYGGFSDHLPVYIQVSTTN